MTTVLFVKANNRPSEESITVKLYEKFLHHYRLAHRTDTLIEIDLYREPLPYLGDVMIRGLTKVSQGTRLTEKEEQEVQIVERHLEQFINADKIVIAFPVWNLTVPAVLHSYLDYMHRPRKTFRYTEDGSVGLLSDKKVMLLNARGGVCDESDPDEIALRFVRNHLNFFGITDINKVVIEGHHEFPERSDEIIQQGLQQAEDMAAIF